MGAVAELFEHIEMFLRRLETYTKVPPTPEMQEVIVKVMAEVLSVLAVATKVIEQGKTSELITDGRRPRVGLRMLRNVFNQACGKC
jgi:hypothetical protein